MIYFFNPYMIGVPIFENRKKNGKERKTVYGKGKESQRKYYFSSLPTSNQTI